MVELVPQDQNTAARLAVPFGEGGAVADVVSSKIAFHSAAKGPEYFSQLLCLLSHQRHKWKHDQCFLVDLHDPPITERNCISLALKTTALKAEQGR